jgi:hypothetical protein
MGGSQYIPSFSLSTFAQAVSSPYTSLNAYRSGTIDEHGNLLKPESSIDDFEYFIIKLKKIFDQVPMSYTRSALDSYATTFKMFSEEAEHYGLKPYEFMFFVEGYLTTLLTEDMTTGSAPGTLGTPAQSSSEGGVMGYEKILGAPPAPFMGGMQMFDVSKEELENFKTHKAWKHIPDSETKKYLQRFQRRNKDSKIAMRALDPETGKYEVHWVKMKPMSFMEEFNIDIENILNEQHTGSQGHHIGHAISELLNNIDDNERKRTEKGEKSKNLGAYATEYYGRGQLMLQGFKDASLHSAEHAKKWIDVSMTTAGKDASKNDKNPDSSPDAWMYDATVKDEDFTKKVRKVDIGTDRKKAEIYVGKEIKSSALQKSLNIGKKILDRQKFKDSVKAKSQDIGFRQEVSPLMSAKNPWLILHNQNMSGQELSTGPRFVLHDPSNVSRFVRSMLYNWTPTWGGKKLPSGELEARPAIQSTDLRIRSSSQPSDPRLEEIGLGAGYDILRREKDSEEPKKAFTVEHESIEHALDNIPDNYIDSKGRRKEDISKALLKMYSTSPLIQKGKTQAGPAKFTEPDQYPLEIKQKTKN